MNLRLAAAAAPILLLAGCSGTPQDVNMAACDAFVYYLREADLDPEAMDRRITVDQVSHEISSGDVEPHFRITDAHAALSRTQEGPTSAWKLAAESFASACIDLGWED